jgi:hypothetical protein
VENKEAAFLIEMFLLMGDNYIDNDALGRECHGKRKMREINLGYAGMNDIIRKFYQSFADAGMGREVVLFARKIADL